MLANTKFISPNNLYSTSGGGSYLTFNFTAGKRHYSSVEIKEFDFSNFYKLYKFYLGENVLLPSKDFLTWLIGFSEGDGSFIISSKGLLFVISQGNKDIQILNFIKNTLGFGNVYSQGVSVSRFIVQDKKGIALICSLFNGNIVLPSKYSDFLLFFNKFNEIAIKGKLIVNQIDILPTLNILPTNNDAWFSGFTDSEGCFTCSLLNSSNAFRFRFVLSQSLSVNKPILDSFVYLFDNPRNIGKVFNHSQPDVFTFEVNGLENCSKLFPYFDKFPLKTKKLLRPAF